MNKPRVSRPKTQTNSISLSRKLGTLQLPKSVPPVMGTRRHPSVAAPQSRKK